MREDGKIDYVEFRGRDMGAIKGFYRDAFGWGFTDYGPAYAAFDQGLEGGFDTDSEPMKPPLVVLYAHDLEAMELRVKAAGGTVTVPIYGFPGGRRFHFADPAGNELAVWSA
ncbi:MAG TPA: VOC family protein [Caulobacteraceae bacterium]|jgi:predicted enzyme related to lactoylglutathione lyase|nr:VOC family protein [Caulobacteraceae bacterium]